MEHIARTGGTVSGGPVDADFYRGWGIHPFKGSKAHHWVAGRPDWLPAEALYTLQSACGMSTVATRQVQLLRAGSYEYCRRCENKLMP